MYLDAQRKHRSAGRLRRQSLKISEQVYGRVHQSTGAASSNLGLCLFGQEKYEECNFYLAQSLKVMIDCFGIHHLSTAAAVYNIYFCLNAQGRIIHAAMPEPFRRALPQMQETAYAMMLLKSVRISLLALLEVLKAIKSQFNP
jgi:hypothetical protein